MRDCVPGNWEMARLDALLGCVEAGSRPKGGVSHIKEGVPSVGGEHLAPNGGFRFEKLKFVPEEFAERHDRGWIELGDILVVKDGATTGKTSFVSSEFPLSRAMINEHVLRLVTSTNLSRKYLFYFLWSEEGHQEILKDFRGTAQGGISKGFASKVKVPIAPKGEQHRIVEAIESYLTRLDAAVASLERVQKNLERYHASVLKAAVEGCLVPTEAELARKEGRDYEPAGELLKRILVERRKKWIKDATEKARAKAEEKAREAGKPWTHTDDVKTLERERAKADKKYKEPAAPDTTNLPDLPEGWCWTSVDSICEVQGGLTKGKRRKPRDVLREVAYLRVANVQRGWLDLDEIKTIFATEGEISRLTLAYGDVLLNEGGDRDKLGRGWVWEEQLPECIHQNHVFRARIIAEAIVPELLSWYGNTKGRDYFFGQGKQTTNLASISLTRLRALPVPLPPSCEQLRISEEVEGLFSSYEAVRSQVAASLLRTSRLRQSILKWAFEGRLVEQHRDDEPASVLLERIRRQHGKTRASG